MGNRRLAPLVGALLCVSHPLFAQPQEGEIEMEGDQPESPPAEQPPAEQAPAEPPVQKDPKVAKKWQRAGDLLIRKGDQLMRQGKEPEAKQQYENAVTAYRKAIEASDDVTLNYQLALAEDKAGLSPDAMKHIKLVLAAQGVKADVMKKAQAKLDELSMKVGLVTLTVVPDGTQVSVEGQPIGEAPLSEPLVLMPGTHKVSLTAVGFQPKDVEIKVEAGSESERSIALEPVPVVTKPEPEEPMPEPSVTPKHPNMLPLYIGGGAAVGLTLVATVTGIIAIGKHSTYTDPDVSASERADAQSSGKTFAHITDICIVGAVGAAAFTAYWYQFKYRPQARALAERPAQAKVEVVPWVQPQAGGLTVAGSF
jgi:hypothetical protein